MPCVDVESDDSVLTQGMTLGLTYTSRRNVSLTFTATSLVLADFTYRCHLYKSDEIMGITPIIQVEQESNYGVDVGKLIFDTCWFDKHQTHWLT